MGERRDLLRKVNRGRAGGIPRCAALEPAKPVYPGKSDRSANQHRSDHVGDPARRGWRWLWAFGHIVCHPGSDTAIWGLRLHPPRILRNKRFRATSFGCGEYEEMVMSNKMWGGRFTDRPAAIMAEINVPI